MFHGNPRLIESAACSVKRQVAFGESMKEQFDVTTAGDMQRVIISGNYFGSKCFPSLNNLLAAYGQHPKSGSRMKQRFQKICCDEIRDQIGSWKASKPIVIHYIFYEPLDGHYRDYMNVYYFAGKCFADALQDCNVIPTDSPKWLKNETHDFHYCVDYYDETRIEVYLEEVDEVQNG